MFRDSTPVLYGVRDTAGVIPLLQPETTYSFTVRASDFAISAVAVDTAGNRSAPAAVSLNLDGC